MAGVSSPHYWSAQIGTFVGFLLVAGVVMYVNGGHLTYTLDDPYIHLALSEQIWNGGYGINAGEHSSPSSSILYPYLLAPATPFVWHEFSPLLVNLVALVLTVHCLWLVLAHLGLTATPRLRLFSALLLLLSTFQLYLIGIVFSGMEHSLHILVVAITIYGVILFLDRGHLPWWLVAALIVGPTIRYEAVATSLAVGLILIVRGAWRTAVLAGLASSSLLAGYSLFLKSLELPVLPSSVMSNSELVNSSLVGSLTLASGVRTLLQNVQYSLGDNRVGTLLTVAAVALLMRILVTFRTESQRSRHLLAGFGLLAITAHFVAGGYGWLNRYEIYIVIAVLLVLLYVWQDSIHAALERLRFPVVVAAMVCLMTLVGLTYTGSLGIVPLAANNIYEQQFQMHRFATEFHQGSVAVNDIGWVAYRNPHYVLDLWGLASDRARRLRESGLTPEALRTIVASENAGVAMIYEPWFGAAVPPEWKLLARLKLGRRRVSPAEAQVEFYATDPETVDEVAEQLRQFELSLPPKATIELYPPVP